MKGNISQKYMLYTMLYGVGHLLENVYDERELFFILILFSALP